TPDDVPQEKGTWAPPAVASCVGSVVNTTWMLAPGSVVPTHCAHCAPGSDEVTTPAEAKLPAGDPRIIACVAVSVRFEITVVVAVVEADRDCATAGVARTAT